MPLRFTLLPSSPLAAPATEVPAECVPSFRLLHDMAASMDDSDDVLQLTVPRSRSSTLEHLVALARLEGNAAAADEYASRSVLDGAGIAGDAALVELMAAADFTGCIFVRQRLATFLMGLIRCADEGIISGHGRPLTAIEKLEVLGEMPLVGRLAGR